MKPQEIELWARDIIDSVLNGQPVEDSRVELKAKWIEAEKAAPRLGGHANASRGENILWLIGVDERNGCLTNVDATEKGDWYKAVEKHFDGFAPRLLADVNFKISGNAVVALYFNTAVEAPYTVKYKSKDNNFGDYPQYIVPWREGTMLRTATREELIRLLIPVYKITSIINELKFNRSIIEFAWFGYLFREDEFNILIRSGVIEDLPKEIKEQLIESYVAINLANQGIQKYRQNTEVGFVKMNAQYILAKEQIQTDIAMVLAKINVALDSLASLKKA